MPVPWLLLPYLVTQVLLDAGANPGVGDAHGATPLHYAAKLGSQSLVRMLLSKGVDANARNSVGNTPLHRAARMGHFDVCWTLLAFFAKVDQGVSFSRLLVQCSNNALWPGKPEAAIRKPL